MTHNNTPSNPSPAISTNDVLQHPFWSQGRYRNVQVMLPDNSAFALKPEDILFFHARMMSKKFNASPEAILVQQLLPTVTAKPQELVQMAARLPAEFAFSVATTCFWRTPKMLATQWWPEEAKITLGHIG